MRSHVPAAFAITLCVLSAFPSAPAAEDSGVHFGLQAGINAARISYDPPAELFQPTALDNDFRTVCGGGATISFTFNAPGAFSLESGLFLHMKGGETSVTIQAYDWVLQRPYELRRDLTWRLLYLSVPILARFSIPLGEVTAYMKAGMETGYLLSAEETDESTDLYGTITVEQDIKNDLTAIDIGLVAGAGVELPRGRVRPFAEVTYCHGLTDIIDPANTAYDVRGHNCVIGIMAGVRF